MSDDSGWIEWKGGVIPVHPNRKVHIRLRGDADSEADGARALPANCYHWAHAGDGADIIAYRVIQQ